MTTFLLISTLGLSPRTTRGYQMMSTADQALLACQRCTRLKTKCSKEQPACAQCKNANVQCVPVLRARRPRGRNGGRGGRTAELYNRIGRLESLVKSLGADSTVSNDGSHPLVTAKKAASEVGGRSSTSKCTPDGTLESFNPGLVAVGPRSRFPMGSTLFAQLSEEFDSIRQILDDSSMDDTGELNGEHPGGSNGQRIYAASCSLFHSLPVPSGQVPVPSAENVDYLLAIFRTRVNPVVKAVHRPTFEGQIRSMLVHQRQWAQDQHLAAVHAAALYACVSSLTEFECKQRFQTPKLDLQILWRRDVEGRLSSSSFLVSERIETLQALIFYLVLSLSDNLKQPLTFN